jgi:hypothetical protein
LEASRKAPPGFPRWAQGLRTTRIVVRAPEAAIPAAHEVSLLRRNDAARPIVVSILGHRGERSAAGGALKQHGVSVMGEHAGRPVAAPQIITALPWRSSGSVAIFSMAGAPC